MLHTNLSSSFNLDVLPSGYFCFSHFDAKCRAPYIESVGPQW